MESKTWTDAEVQQLQKMLDEGLSAGAIAERIGRTRRAVIAKIGRIQNGVAPNVRKSWSDSEIESLLSLRDKYSLGWDQIGYRLGRPSGSVYSKYMCLKYETTRHAADPRISVPSASEQQWRHRQALAPRDLTAAVFGDPLPGFSALDKREAA